jgi:SAM-dependent methyltransferase
MSYNRNFYLRRVERYSPLQIEVSNRLNIIWKPQSVFDVGCGIGGYLQRFNELGIEIAGCDIGYDIAKEFMNENVKSKTYAHDLTTEINSISKYDLVLCVEVAEHIDSKFSMQFCENIVRVSKNRIFFTAAHPGQYGNGHVNCQPKQYWIDRMQIFGAIYDEYDTDLSVRTLQPIDKLGICKNYYGF